MTKEHETPDAGAQGQDSAGERIAKRLARAGLCSRREAERWIAQGRVTVNGRKLDSPALNVGPKDRIIVDNKPLPDLADQQPAGLWRYHKPSGLVTTHRDPEGRETVFDALPKELGRVISVGRLDLTSEGLLLLTNDGGLARHLELPSSGLTRRYRVRVNGTVHDDLPDILGRGVRVDGIDYSPVTATIDSRRGANAWLTLTLKEGKNREIRRILEARGLRVTRLIRISYGPYQLGDLARGEVAVVPRRVLRDQLGASGSQFGLGSDGFAEKSDRKKDKRTGGKRPAFKKRAGAKTPSSSDDKGRKTGRTGKAHADHRRRS